METCIWQILNYFSLIVFLVVVACKISTTCVYYTKLTILYLGIFNCVNLMSIYGLFHKPLKTYKFSKTMLDPIGWLLNIRYTVKGEEHIDKTKPYIIVANHQHVLDMVTGPQVHNKKHYEKSKYNYFCILHTYFN